MTAVWRPDRGLLWPGHVREFVFDLSGEPPGCLAEQRKRPKRAKPPI